MKNRTFAELLIVLLDDLECTQRFINMRQSANPEMSEQQLQAKIHGYRRELLETLTPLAAQEAVGMLSEAEGA